MPIYRSDAGSPTSLYCNMSSSPFGIPEEQPSSRVHSPLVDVSVNNFAWLTGVGATLYKFNLNTRTVVGTVTIPGNFAFYIADVDNIRRKLVALSDLNLCVMNLDNPADHYVVTLSGFFTTRSTIIDLFRGYSWVVGTDASSGARVVVYDYMNADLVTSFQIPTSFDAGIFSLGMHYAGSQDDDYMYFTTSSSPDLLWPLVRISKSNYSYSKLLPSIVGSKMTRRGVFDGFLYITRTPITGPFKLVKISTSTFTVSASLDGPFGTPGGGAMEIDRINKRLFYGHASGLVKVNLIDFASVDYVTSPATIAQALVYDEQRNVIYNGISHNMLIWNPDNLTYTTPLNFTVTGIYPIWE